jgi:hypothetical protein
MQHAHWIQMETERYISVEEQEGLRKMVQIDFEETE